MSTRLGTRKRTFAHAESLRLIAVGFIAASLSVTSCGSKTSEAPGSGAAGSAGSSGASSAGASTAPVCTAGDTRECVGPGACSGGQACGVNGQWSACDCGGSEAGASSSGGRAGVVGSGGFGGLSGAAGDATSEAGSASSGVGGSSGDSSVGVPDEPCPSGTILADCSGQCQPKATECTSECPVKIFLSNPIHAGDVLARTPSHPGVQCSICDSVAPPFLVYDMSIIPPGAPTETLHVTVPPPWFFETSSTLVCVDVPDQLSCMKVTSKFIAVRTSDPNAGSVDMVVAAGDCP